VVIEICIKYPGGPLETRGLAYYTTVTPAASAPLIRGGPPVHAGPEEAKIPTPE
jgi:hypothetical protein